MEKLLSEDETTQNLINYKSQLLWKSHLYLRQKIKESELDRYIRNKSVEEYEKILYESLTEDGKTRDPYKRFIQEKLELVYINKKIDDGTLLKMRVLYPHYRKWHESNFPRMPVPDYVHVRANFIHVDRLGPENAKDGWVGYKIKKT
jgi:hypothetical protein